MFIGARGQGVLLASGASTQGEPRPRRGRRGCRGGAAPEEGPVITLIRLPRLPGPLPCYTTAAESLRILVASEITNGSFLC